LFFAGTWWHIQKNEPKHIILHRETAQDFAQITETFISDLPAKKTQWIHDILDGKKEQDRVLLSDGSFVTVMQPSWKDVNDSKNMFYLVLLRAERGELRSLRDLNGSHVAMLKDMEEKCYDAMEKRHGMTRGDIKAYFHYQPSFFHLHVHFRALGAEADPSALTAREHPLEDVIENLMIDSEYYKRKTLAFSSSSHPKLSSMFMRSNRSSKKIIVVDAGVVFEDKDFKYRTHGKFFMKFCTDNFRVALRLDGISEVGVEPPCKDDLEYFGSCTDAAFFTIVPNCENVICLRESARETVPPLFANSLVMPVETHADELAPWGVPRKLLWSWVHAKGTTAPEFAALRFLGRPLA